MNKKILLKLSVGIIFIIIIVLAYQMIYKFNEGFDSNQNAPQDIPNDGKIPDGFYKVSDVKMTKVPYGYRANDNKDGIIASSQSAFWSDYAKNYDKTNGNIDLTVQSIDASKNQYRYNDYSMTYHDSAEDIKKQGGIFDASFGTVMVLDPCGNKVLIPYSPAQPLPIYYTPGTYKKYGASTYVPSYEDSVYLSKSTMRR
jgi:hypothetical protein